jgi:kanamycin kinase/aminoglycoside 3'-phosphotransferase-2
MKVKLSERLEREYGNVDWEYVTIGQSHAQVYQSHELILKIQLKTNRESLLDEKSKIEWLKKRVSVPDIIDYDTDETNEYLIMSRLHGKDAAQTKWLNDPINLVTQLGHALRHLHDNVDITNCPFDRRLTKKLEETTRYLKTLDKQLVELFATAPDEDLVFTHGDYCLPNIMIDEELGNVVGFVDLGHAGIADRYHDLALCLRSMQYNIGKDYSQIFLQAYGLFTTWNENKIAFYQQLEDLL